MTTPCYMCAFYHKQEQYCDLLTAKPSEDGTCEDFEHEDQIVEAQIPKQMNKIRGKKRR